MFPLENEFAVDSISALPSSSIRSPPLNLREERGPISRTAADNWAEV